MTKIQLGVAPVTPTDAFFGAAEGYLEGVRVMIAANPPPAFALTLVAGHTLECALKAFLAKVGITEDKLRSRTFGHDVIKLWKAAHAKGLPLPDPMPDWVDQLNRVYSFPFVARYPMGINGVVLPNQSAMSSGVEYTVQAVRSAIR